MKKDKNDKLIVEQLLLKAGTKQAVYRNTLDVFKQFKENAQKIALNTKSDVVKKNKEIIIDYKDKGAFTAELKFGSDLIVMNMHTNVFHFSRDHELMKTSYVKEDIMRSYCGVINIYNFLSDSFKYNRVDDVGYLIARVFINKDLHFYVEGKRRVGLLYNNFIKEVISDKHINDIIKTVILYCIDFDLLTPYFGVMPEVSVGAMKQNTRNMSVKTGKRLGFKFQSDADVK